MVKKTRHRVVGVEGQTDSTTFGGSVQSRPSRRDFPPALPPPTASRGTDEIAAMAAKRNAWWSFRRQGNPFHRQGYLRGRAAAAAAKHGLEREPAGGAGVEPLSSAATLRAPR